MRFPYKSWPYPADDPLFANKFDWSPILTVRVSYPARHSPPSRPFEAWVDSGSPHCYFQSDVGRAIGIRIESGIESELGGIIAGPKCPVYFHDVALHIGTEIIRLRAGFCDTLAAAGILGRMGFFNNFIINFDPSSTPPGLDLTRILRA